MAPKKAVPKRGGGAVAVEPTVSASSSAAMDAKKPFRGLMAQFSAISHVADRDLLTALLSIFSDIRKIPTTEAPALIAALRGEHLSMEVMVEPLLHNRCVRSSLPSVAEVVGWILCDVVRLHRAVVGEGGATSDALPFPRSSCDDVVGCIIAPFEALVEQQKQKGSASLHKCEGIIERAAAARVFSALMPACLRTETTARLEACFEAVRAASSSRSGGGGGAGNNNNTNSAGATTAGTAAEMARMLNDILDATHAITVEQLRPLLEEIIRASPMLRELANNNNSSTSTSRSLAASVPARTSKDLGAVIAARVLMEQRDLIQPAIASYVMEVLRSGLEELRGVGDATGDASLERKRRGLKSVAYALELLIALMELETALVRSLVERLAPLLRHEEQEVRQLLLRGVSSALLSNEGALAAYPAAFHESLARLADPKPPIRMEAVVFLGKLMERATRLWSASPAAADRWRRLWGTTVQPQLNQALIDAHYLVRRQAVHTYCDILLAPLSAPHSLLTFVDDDDGTTTLSRTLGRRTADLHPKVRQTAVECLAALYGRLPCAWIPGAVMQTLRAEGGIHTVEVCWELMLPTERGATNTSSPSSSSSLANTQPRLTSHSTLAATAEMAVFEFEKQQLLQERSYAEAWASLCADLPDSSFAQLLTMAKKKPQLRRAIQRLFELRSDIKAAVDPRAETSQAIIHNIQRLLVFLAGITHATKGEWDELFRSKDEKVGKALLLACEPQNINWIDVRADLLARLHGRLETDVQSFMEGSLAKQLMMPFQLAHVEELLSRISAAFAAAREPAMSEEEAAAAITKCAPSTALHMLGMIRAVLICTATSPSFWGYTDALRVLMEAMVQLHHMHVGVVGMSGWLAVAQLLMHALMEWAGLGEDLSLGISHTSCLAKVPAEVRKGVVEVLVALSHGHLSASTTAQAAGDEEVGYAAAARLGKRAARTLLALLRVRGMGEAQTICTALSEDLHTQLHHSNPHQQGTSCTSSLAILHAVRALAGDPLTAPLMRDATLANDLRRWLRTALAEDGPDAGAETAKIRPTRHSSTASATGSGEGLELPMEDELITSAGVLSQTASGAVVEACAKTLVAVALNAVASDRPDAISSTIAEFLAGYKVACARPIHAVGGARRRLALGQQLLKLVRLPSANMAQELSVAMIISSEDCPVVRQCLQRKLAHHLLHGTCDMRYAALLLLTAVSEESRASFQLLRQLVRRVGDHLRAKQAATVMQLSDPAALYCFLEYSIPFLTLFMAHHPMYESERSTGFIAYQRTWHLLMEELFRHNTACGSVVVELLNRIKQADDVLEPESNATRVLCDLGSVVMHACLSQHQCSVESLRRYPGKLLLPSFYTAANRPDRLTTAYLDPSFRAAPNAPFTRTATTTTTTAAHNQDELQQSLSRGTSPSATPEMAASSTPRNARKTMRTTTPSATPAKRSRSEGTSCASPRAAVDRVLDGLFAGLRRPQIAALRWKTVKAAIDAALAAQPAAAVVDEGSTEMILGYAKEQLRQRYEHAEP